MNICMVISFLLSVCSTTIMAYISMATPIGPWIAPTVLLCALLVYHCCYTKKQLEEALIFTTVCASVGGILATAFGFTFPTLYFLDSSLFNSWLAQPLYFCTIATAVAGVAGWYGLWIANVTESLFLDQETLPFPIAQLIYKMIMVQQEIGKAIALAIGFVSTMIFCLLQEGTRFFGAIIPKTVLLCSSMSYYCFEIPLLPLDLWPMLWAIGFVTGHVIVMPLLVGSVSRILIAQPIQHLLFPTMSAVDFILAFCSGMVISGVLIAFIPTNIKQWINKPSFRLFNDYYGPLARSMHRTLYVEGVAICLSVMIVLSYLGFGFISQWYLLVCTFMCAYQIIIIAGKIGLAQLGRFATFVLVPALFLFNVDVVQITVISMFVEISTGVAVDLLVGRKVALLAHADEKKARWYQYAGLLVASVTIGIVCWLLITHFGLGSPELFAQRGQARALLIHAQQFDYVVVLIGIMYGLVLKKIKLNPMLVLGGLLMPLNISIGLVIGGLAASVMRDAQAYFPFWSGVFAANSIWMLIRTLM